MFKYVIPTSFPSQEKVPGNEVYVIHVKMFATFVEYSGEKNVVDVIFFGSTVGSHHENLK